ncbi:MAG: response regulator [Alphaproteobacteria bacterium]|nr:response regulator [Alphaproteobacteria bacterium]
MQNGHIYIVDDNKDIRDLTGRYLAEHGYKTSMAEDGRALRALIKTGTPDLVVLDIMMPGEDGLSLCRYLRETTEVPIIMLTAMADETDRIIGLEMGADDYLTKPFNPRELLARIKSVLRRAQSLPPRKLLDIEAANEVRFNGWVLNVKSRELVDKNGINYVLSTAEFMLLSVFLLHPNTELNRDQLLELARGREAQLFDRSIDNLVSRLRRKVEVDHKKPELIKTVWGKGYMFCANVELD